jgi:regulator of protease activity HflC (stomatin/prohibitin superfamily)
MIQGVSVFAIVVVAFIVITVLMGVRQVPQGFNYTVERFGRYYKTLTPGLGLIVPYIDSIGRKLNVMEQVVDVPRQEIITKDNATVAVDGVAFYQVLDVRRASYEVANLERALLNLVMTNIRTVMGSMDLDQLLSHRDDINARLLSVIDAAFGDLGRESDADRDQGHRAAEGSGRFDGPADEGRTREARDDPRGRGPETGGDHSRRRA